MAGLRAGFEARRECVGLSGYTQDFVRQFQTDGYVVVRGFYSAAEIGLLREATDQLYDEGVRHGRCFRHGNLFYNVAADARGEKMVRMVQWPSYHQGRLNAVRLDPRFVRLLDPLIGRDLKQIINQVHWKAPGSLGDFAWHQDSRSRRPASAYRNLGAAYVQTGLAIDPHTPESGCLRFVPGSHKSGDLGLDCPEKVLGSAMNDEVLIEAGLSADDAVDLLLEPGDLALWSPYLVHGSGTNRAAHRRRLYINGYVRAGDCDRGEWAFRDGKPVPFGPEPALVHYEALRDRGEPHYP